MCLNTGGAKRGQIQRVPLERGHPSKSHLFGVIGVCHHDLSGGVGDCNFCLTLWGRVQFIHLVHNKEERHHMVQFTYLVRNKEERHHMVQFVPNMKQAKKSYGTPTNYG